MSRSPLHVRLRYWLARQGERIADGWAALTSPIERLFGRLGESFMGAFDSFEGLESLVLRGVKTLFWPLTALGGLVGRWLPRGDAGPLGWASRMIARQAAATYRLAERLNLDGLLQGIAWLATPVWRPIAGLLGFTRAWLATRRPRELLLATPALVLAAPFAYVGVSGAMLGRTEIAERYKVAVRDATESKDYQRVELLERKLAQLGVDTRRGDYRVALALAESDDLAGAYARMKRLAPEDAAGYLPAQAWIIQQLVSGALTAEHEPALAAGEEAVWELASRRLDLLEGADANPMATRRVRAVLAVRQGDLSGAAKILEPAAETDHEAAVMRMQLLAQLKDLEAARKQARPVLQVFADPRRRPPAAQLDHAGWVLAAQLVEDPTQTEVALEAWIEADPTGDRPRELMSAYKRELAERLIRDETAAPTRTAEAIVEALRLGAPEPWLAQNVTQLVARRTTSRTAQLVWDALQSHPDGAPELAEALATGAASSGDIVAAREGFAKLLAKGDDRPVALNNYAWTLLQEPAPDPQAALEAVQRALRTRPNDFRFRETRGQALVQLGRWEEGIEDLEYALNGLPEANEVHRSLATAYDALKKPQLAELHRRQATP